MSISENIPEQIPANTYLSVDGRYVVEGVHVDDDDDAGRFDKATALALAYEFEPYNASEEHVRKYSKSTHARNSIARKNIQLKACKRLLNRRPNNDGSCYSNVELEDTGLNGRITLEDVLSNIDKLERDIEELQKIALDEEVRQLGMLAVLRERGTGAFQLVPDYSSSILYYPGRVEDGLVI